MKEIIEKIMNDPASPARYNALDKNDDMRLSPTRVQFATISF